MEEIKEISKKYNKKIKVIELMLNKTIQSGFSREESINLIEEFYNR